jgi:quercetin dioxygenase-like cupin family protein
MVASRSEGGRPRTGAGDGLDNPGADSAGVGIAPSCESPVAEATPRLEASGILRYDGAGWTGVRTLPYKTSAEDFAGMTRRILASPEAAAFEVRYFEVDPGGHSSLERHAHIHVVIGYRGRGRVRLGDAVHEVGFGDVVYVAPGDAHQFLNPYGDPFGFLCIVDRDRDRPEPIGG